MKNTVPTSQRLISRRIIWDIVYTKEYLDTIKYTQIGYKKFELNELKEYGKQAGFENVETKKIMNGKGFVVIYTK